MNHKEVKFETAIQSDDQTEALDSDITDLPPPYDPPPYPPRPPPEL